MVNKWFPALKKHFITGLVILLPLVVTIGVLVFLINFLTRPFVGAASALLQKFHLSSGGFLFLSHNQVVEYGSRALILMLLLLLTIGLGIVTRSFLVNACFRLGDKLLSHIPIVNTVYKTTQDIIKTLFVSEKDTFKQVVMAPFPRAGVYALGLVVRESPKVCQRMVNGEELLSVLIPTTPNPTTGFLLMFRREELIFVPLKPEDAIKYIVSCGVILPAEMPVAANKDETTQKTSS